jgi:hypothetical protein
MYTLVLIGFLGGDHFFDSWIGNNITNVALRGARVRDARAR